MVRDRDEYIPRSLYRSEREELTGIGNEFSDISMPKKILYGVGAFAAYSLFAFSGSYLVWDLSRIEEQKPSIEVLASSAENIPVLDSSAEDYAISVGKPVDRYQMIGVNARDESGDDAHCRSKLAREAKERFPHVEVVTNFSYRFESLGLPGENYIAPVGGIDETCYGEALIPINE